MTKRMRPFSVEEKRFLLEEKVTSHKWTHILETFNRTFDCPRSLDAIRTVYYHRDRSRQWQLVWLPLEPVLDAHGAVIGFQTSNPLAGGRSEQWSIQSVITPIAPLTSLAVGTSGMVSARLFGCGDTYAEKGIKGHASSHLPCLHSTTRRFSIPWTIGRKQRCRIHVSESVN